MLRPARSQGGVLRLLREREMGEAAAHLGAAGFQMHAEQDTGFGGQWLGTHSGAV